MKPQKKEIVIKSVHELTPYAKNARVHTGKQVQMIADSIKEFGFNNPVLIDGKGNVIAGHGRLMAARKLKMADVPCLILDHMTEAQKRAYILADNQIALKSGWDDELLKAELDELKCLDFNIDLIGFEQSDLDAILGASTKQGACDPDDVPALEKKAVSALGDVWLLGSHRLMCGDSTSIDAVEKLMAGKKADMVFTSPPYNANAKAGQGDIFNGKKSVKLYADGYKDDLNSSEYVDFASSVLEVCFLVTDGFIFWNVSYNANSRFEYIEQIKGRLDFLIEQICWKKSSTIPFKGSLMRDWEPIYVFSTDKKPLNLKEVTSNFWQISNTGAQTENHKACFPVELPEKGISICPIKTNILFDPFGGSGSTLIACEKTSRNCYMMELDPIYCDVIIKRWQAFTGKKATLESSGKSFEEVAHDRA